MVAWRKCIALVLIHVGLALAAGGLGGSVSSDGTVTLNDPSVGKRKPTSTALKRLTIPYFFDVGQTVEYKMVKAYRYLKAYDLSSYNDTNPPPVIKPKKKKGKRVYVPVWVPKPYLKYNISVTYVRNPNIIYLDAENFSFYNLSMTLPHPKYTVWLIGRHRGFLVNRKYTKRRIVEEALHHNVRLICLNAQLFDLKCTGSGLEGLVYDGKPLPLPDAAYVRVGAVVDYHGLAVLRHLKSLGVRVFNDFNGVSISRDKMYTYQVLSAKGVSIPKTLLGRTPVPFDFVQSFFGYPMVVKQTSGSKGEQVWKVDNRSQLEQLSPKLSESPYVFQEYVRGSKGKDIRAFVVGNKVVAAMLRTATKGSFKSNLHQGGTARQIHVGGPLERMVLKTSRLVQLDVAGVDLLVDKTYKVCEVNSSPGIEGLEKATGINVAKAIVEYMIEELDKLPPRKPTEAENVVPVQSDHMPQPTDGEVIEEEQPEVADPEWVEKFGAAADEAKN